MDALLLGRDREHLDTVRAIVEGRFGKTHWANPPFGFRELNVCRAGNGPIYVGQREYAMRITPVALNGSESDKSLGASGVIRGARSKLGQSSYLAHRTRPDLAVEAGKMVSGLAKFQVRDVARLDSIIAGIQFIQVSYASPRIFLRLHCRLRRVALGRSGTNRWE